MSFIGWYKAKKQNYQEYWQATETVSRPLAILLSLLVLFVCVALVFTLFLGGRWLYRRVFEHNASGLTTSQTQKIPANNSTTDIETTPTPTANANASSGVSTTPTPTPTGTPSPTATPATGSNIPNTGPDGSEE
jgi:hypothetical protein